MSGGGTRGMQHLYTGAKGDPLCPLGFHPQVRWPTRCKRCFRDYKDHGGAKREETSLRKDETTLSSPLLSSNQSSTSSSRFRDGLSSDAGGSRGWNSPSLSSRLPPGRTSASSWTSTPDLQSLSSDTTSKDTTSATVRLRLPSSTSPSTSSSTQTYSSLKPPIPPSSSSSTSTASKSSSASSDSEGDKVLDWLQRYHERRRVGESAQTALNSSYSPPSKTSESSTPLRSRRLLVQEVKTVDNTPKESSKETTAGVNPDVEFIIRVKSSASKAKEKEKEKANAEKDSESDDDDSSVAATETTDTTLVGAQGEKSFNEEEMESLRQELAELRTRCEKAEREKNDILLRRVTTASRTSSSELLRLQQKVNELSSVKEKLEEEKRSLNLKVNELTEEVEKSKVKKKKKKKLSETSAAAIAIRRRRALLAGRSFNEDDEDDDDEDDEETKRAIEDLKNKLTAAEQLCEELMDENSEMKKEIRELEEEMEEMQDNFREDQVDEYTSLKKELEQTAKNCRILQFKLRKAERRAETLETERNEAVARSGSGATEAQKKLEHDLSLANQVALRLQSEVESLQEKLKASEEGKKKFGLKVDEVPKRAPKLAAIAKSSSGERPTRESLTRGGSQEDPVQLLRDLQDSMEREADLREQLRFAEEELRRRRSFVAPRLSCCTRAIQVVGSELESLSSSSWKPASTPPPLPPRQNQIPVPPLPPFPSSPKLKHKIIGPKYPQTKGMEKIDTLIPSLSTEMGISTSLKLPPAVFSENKHLRKFYPLKDCGIQTAIKDQLEILNSELKEALTNDSGTQTTDCFSKESHYLENKKTIEMGIQVSPMLENQKSSMHIEGIDFGTQSIITLSEMERLCSLINKATYHAEVQTSLTLLDLNLDAILKNVPTSEFGAEITPVDLDLRSLDVSQKTVPTISVGVEPLSSISEVNKVATFADKIETLELGTQTLWSMNDTRDLGIPVHVVITNETCTQTCSTFGTSEDSNDVSAMIVAPTVCSVNGPDATHFNPQACSQNGLQLSSLPSAQLSAQPSDTLPNQSSIGEALMSNGFLAAECQPSPPLSDLSHSPSLTIPSLPSSGKATPELGPSNTTPHAQHSSAGNSSTSLPSLISFLSPTPPSTPSFHTVKSCSVGVQCPLNLEHEDHTSTVTSREISHPSPKAYASVGIQCSQSPSSRPSSPMASSSSVLPSSILAPLQQISLSSMFPSLLGSGSPMAAFLMPLARKQSPSPARLTPEPSLEKDEGISEDDDPAELRLQLELNEQETAVLRRKVEELEKEGETTKKKMKELQDKLAEKKTVPAKTIIPAGTGSAKGSAISEQKIKVLEEEANELRRKLIEKERDCERLNAELTLTQKRSKGLMQRSRSLDSGGGAPLDQATLDLKRQLQVVEQEANILRSKTQELEAECERVTAENKKLSLSKAAAGKRTTEIKTLRERVKELEAKLGTSEGVKSGEGESKESSKDKKESPESMSSSDVEALKIKLEKAEAEVEQLTSELNKAKDPKSALLRKRTAKRPTDLTPRLQLKKMVEELEIEIAELLVVLKNTDAEKEKLSTELKKSSAGEKEALEKEREQWENDKKEKEKFAKELEEIKAKLTTAEKELKKVQGEKLGAEEETKKKKDEEIRKLKEGKNKIEADLKKIEKEKSELQSELQKIKTEKDSTSSKWEDELKDMIERMDKLRKEVEVERASCEEAKTKLDEAKETAQREKSQMEKEVTDKTKKLAENEKKTKEIEEKLKKIERIGLTRKEKISKLEKEVQEEREKVKQLEGRQKEVSAGWLKEREELKKVSEEAQIKVAELESQITLLEESVKDEQKKTQDLQQQVGRSKEESDVIKGLQDELIDLKKKLEESNESLEKSEKQRKVNEEKLKKAEAEIKKDKGKAREDHLKEIEKLEQQLAHEKQEYDDLTTKYEMLEEDYVVTKAQLVSEKEAAESQLLVAKHEMDNLDEELETLRDSYNSKQDMWIKEKIDLQECLKEAEEKASRAATSNDSWTMERSRLRDSLEEKTKETEKLRREAEVISDQINHLRRENEELKSKLEDFDKVAKIQRSMAADTSALEKQLREAKNNLSLEEKNHKAEVSTLKMRYDNRISLLSEELESSQNTAARFRRERDAQRHLLEAAQKSMAELRKSAASRTKGSESPADDMGEDAAGRIATLEQEVACLEDELSEARLDKSRLKTELVNERSAWEVKIAEMQSRVNELEEDRILSSGRTRVAGVRTRMELAWHKEREEQHRLLQETTTLARDLRQTLFEVERERDKERLEAKKKAEQLKRSMEEEQEENKKKLIELQNDLLELRDAHAKLRTTNEKLRRDREKLQERIEREREETRIGMASRKKNKMDEEKKVIALLDQVDALMKLAPELFPQQQRPSQDRPSPSPMLTTAAPTTPLIPKRTKGPRSRENSPILERKELRREGSVTSLNAEEEKRGHQLQWALQRLTEATEELRRSHRQGLDEERDGSISSSSRRGIGMRRAASTESEPDESTRKKSSTLSRLGAPGSAAKKKGSLIRKSISLEQTSGHAASSASEQSIWKMDADGSTGSLQSIEAASEILDDRYPSLDRLSAGSTQSEIGTTKKKKTGIFGKLKKLTKSKSIDEGNLRDYDGSTQGGSVIGSGSDISVGTEELEERGRGKDLKGKLSGLFKKSGSRSSSMERGSSEKVGPMSSATSDHGASPAQRPLSRTALSRPSPARSDSSHTSSTSRPLTASATPRAVISRK
ncbi:golgin subfamily A member 4 isoform X1 [Hetaerina americana]|uniref:golgin subfamily A member 4 isoform X1 n=1 Tax=Hetaerina americana TaxID=62018 RepID=UPI003A7F4C93